jgi:AAA domain
MNNKGFSTTEPDAPEVETKQSKLREQLTRLTDTAANLQRLTFPPLHYVVPGIIPEGLTLLAGKPKVGKSFLCLDVAIAVATGGYCLGKGCEQGDVMALFLEDTKRRMQRRITAMLGACKDDWPVRLTYATEFNRLDDGGLEMLYLWAKEVEKPRLIVIDLWERFRPPPNPKNGSRYSADYSDLAKVQKTFAAEFPQLGILVTNHQRKATAEDIFDTISGTLGLNGGADTLMVLAREEGAKTLEVRGRDITDLATIVEQDEKTLRWRNVGAKHEGASTPERKKVVEAMRGKGPMSVAAIAKATGKSHDVTKNLLYKMHMDEVTELVSEI